MKLRVADYIRLASEISALSIDEINGQCRQRLYIRPRMLVAYFAKQDGHSYPQIAKYMGGRDHTTIMNLVTRADILKDRDPIFARMFGTMSEAVEAGRHIVRTVPVVLVRKPKHERPSEAADWTIIEQRQSMRVGSERLLAALSRATKVAA